MKRKTMSIVVILTLLITAFAIVPSNVSADDPPKDELPGESYIYQGGNNVLDLDIGERYSTLWEYKYDGTNWGESCWREEYSLWYNSAIHESSGFLIDDYFGTTYNDADKHARLHTGNLYVDRDIYISTGNNRFFQISYIIKNEARDSSYADVRWFQQVDYDVPETGDHTDDTGWFDAGTDFVWIKDPDYFQNGFTGSITSDDHGMAHYSTELSDDHDGDLNSANNYYGDPAVGLQYNIGTLEPGDSWSITMTFWFGLPITVIANAGPDQTVNEGTEVTFDGSGSYTTGSNTITEYAWDFDGDFDYDDGYGVNPTYTFCEDGTYQVWLRVTDDLNQEAYDSMTVIVNNVAPEIASLTVTPSLVALGDPVTLDATFTDPGCDTWYAEIDWDNDGDYDEIIDPATSPITTTHSYADTGVYTVKLKVTDDDGGFDTEIFQYVVVYDPDEGFVTGGGWINSPAGAYAADPTLEGTANFGFVSKYKKGQQTPTGNTEFQYQIGNINFHSSSYHWLVIAGHKAMYKGTGTINGDGNYGFMISAIDEKLTPSTDVDLFRIKIWDEDDGDAIVYDNGLGADEDEDPTTEIAGGQIVIHKK